MTPLGSYLHWVAGLSLFNAALADTQASAARRFSQGSLWSKEDRAEANRELRMRVSLTLPGDKVADAARVLDRLSDPVSPDFGKYWSASQVAKHFSPTPETIKDTVSWLTSSGIPASHLRISHDRSHVSFNTTVHQAERLLKTKYHDFSMKSLHAQTEEGQVAAEEYSIPTSLFDRISYIHPTFPLQIPNPRIAPQTNPTEFRRRQKEVIQRSTKLDCVKYTTPDCLRLLYNIPADSTEIHPNNSLGIFQMSWKTWLPEDLDLFFSRFGPGLVGERPIVQPINGGYLQQDYKGFAFNAEPAVDFEYAMSLVHPQPVINVQVGDKFTTGGLNNMLAAFDQYYCGALDPKFDDMYPNPEHVGGYNHTTDCGNSAPPKVISISYAWNEQAFPPEYLERQCQEYLKLGLQGVTAVAATGDGGTADQLDQCLDPETGSISEHGLPGSFSATFPASCPWVTAVGGTSLSRSTNQTGNGNGSVLFPPETAYRFEGANSTSTSGGGFSRLFPTPPFQARQKAMYLAQQRNHTSQFSARFNPDGRAYPDVSLLASNYVVVYDGALHSLDGTSASTPVFAAMVARINNARLLAGKSTVGWMNPVLYRNTDAFRDVTAGSNVGCGVDDAFKAQGGWDPVTGLGSPDWGKLADVYMALP